MSVAGLKGIVEMVLLVGLVCEGSETFCLMLWIKEDWLAASDSSWTVIEDSDE